MKAHRNSRPGSVSKRAAGVRMPPHRSCKAALLGSALLVPFFGTPAFAQTADEATVDTNTIIVTAQRRSEALENVPMSVAVVNQETLSALGVNSVRDLQNVTSGFLLNNSGSVPAAAIRGVTTTNAGSYENNVALFVDGLYQTTPAVLNMDLPNVQNIQVLKGPQGTLYGRNATGGAILIDTIDPGSELDGNIEATYGRFDDRRLRGYVAAPVATGVGFSLAGNLRRTDGYYKQASRTTPGQFAGRFLGLKQDAVRAKLKLEVADSFRATVGYNYLRSNDPRGVFFTPVENVANNYVVPGRDTRPRGLGEASGDVFLLNLKQHEAYLKLELETGLGTLRSTTGYADTRNATTYDAGGTYVPDSYSDSVVRDRTFQENVDFNVNAIDNVDLILGGNYYNIKTDYLPGRANVAYLGPASFSPFTYLNPATTVVPLSAYRKFQEIDYKRTKEAWAVFADLTFHVSDKLSITAGGRYSKETQDVAAEKHVFCTDPTVASQAAAGCTTATIGARLAGAVGTPYTLASSAKTSSYNKFTPRASIRYEFAPRSNVYFSYSKGFRGGEWNAVPPTDNPATGWFDAKQETIDAFELGVKTAGSRFRADLAGFYYNYKNLQISNTIFIPPGIAVVTLQNAPKAKIYGIEGNFDFSVTDDFKITGGATWLHARYGDGFVFTGTGVNPNAVGFNTNSDPLKTFVNVGNVYQNASGMQMARAPDFSGFIGFDYNIPNGDGGLRFSGNVKYTSSYVVTDISVWGGESAASYNARKAVDPNALPDNTAILRGTAYVNDANKQRARQGAYALVNASVTWTDPTGHQYVRIWGNNLTNVQYKTHYRPSSSTYIPVGEPLTFGGTIGYKF